MPNLIPCSRTCNSATSLLEPRYPILGRRGRMNSETSSRACTHRRLPSARKRSDSQACEFKFRLPQVASSALSSTLHSHFLTLNGRGTTCWEIALVKSASCQLDEKRPFRALEEPRQVRPQGRNADYTSKWIVPRWRTQRPNRRRSVNECYGDVATVID